MELCKRQLTDSTFPWLLEVFLWLQSGQWNIKTQVMCETSGRECPFLLIFPFCLSVICVWVLSHSRCVQLFVALWTVARQAPLSMDSPHKNTGVGSPGGLSNLEIKPGSSTLHDDSLWSEPPGKPSVIWMPMNFNSVIPPPKLKNILLVFLLSWWGISGTEGPGASSQVIYFWWNQVSHSESIALWTICITTASPERNMELHFQFFLRDCREMWL